MTEPTTPSERRNLTLRQRQREDRAIRDLVLRTLMSEPNGRRYVWQELSEAYVFQQTFSAAPGGYAITSFREGQRAMGLRLLSDITRLCPNEYMRMTVENAPVELKEDPDVGTD